ncbi:MAG TPA: hypothetical protein P5077_01785 [bacterium]|nr:hypothetical protein [bacterium]
MKALNRLLRVAEHRDLAHAISRENACSTRELREIYQVNQFNSVWNDAWRNVPFYAAWKKKYSLPDQIISLDELESWPIVTKKELQSNAAFLVRTNRPPDSYGMTGGSTGEPLRFGSWKENAADFTPNMWMGRGAYGVEPGDRTCLLWGHQHLYGTGWRRQVNHLKRRIKDWLNNSYRISAYDLSPDAMKDALRKMCDFGPEFVIAFSPAMIAFCRTNRKDAEICRRLKVKCVMCTAGPLTQKEQEEIGSFFNASVCMEYGSAECGVMAYTVPAGGYRTFWQTHLLQTVPDFQNAHRNIVTILKVRYFPLIRYDIGDYLELYPDEIQRPHRFISVIGRPSEIVKFPDGTAFFGALIGDCVKQVQRVTANQTVIRGDSMLIRVLADGALTAEESALIIQRCRTVVPALVGKSIMVEQVKELKMGVSGKVPLVMYE